MENQEAFWVVWREGDRREPTNKMGRNPTVKHFDPDLASQEAQRLANENPGAKFHVLCKVRSYMVIRDPIQRVFEQYRHLDKLISDKRWGVCAGPGLIPHFQCLRDLWQAIKESQEGKGE